MTEAAISLGKEPWKRLCGRHVVRFLLPILSVAACLFIWEAAVRVLAIPVYMLPAPSQIIGTLISQSQMLFKQAIATSVAIIAGFALAVVIGIPLAALMVYSRFFNRAIYPVLLTAQVLPKVALAPLFIVWFGFGVLPKIVMTFLIAFFPIVIDTATGLNLVRPESLMLIRSMGGSRWQSFWKIRLPTALPNIFAGLKVAITFAVVGAIVAEFVASDSGLGYVLVEARANLDMRLVFAAIAWLILIGFVFYFGVELLERLAVRGRKHGRPTEISVGL